MYTIQYSAVNGENKMTTFDTTNRSRLIAYLAKFERPIIAVYEQASPITKAVRAELQKQPARRLSRYARDFATSLQ